jgi:Glycosyl hydrolases family 28/Bacterial Ig-like domain (group 3)/Right handed beta helix region/Bacterial Ig-like domain (group 2)
MSLVVPAFAMTFITAAQDTRELSEPKFPPVCTTLPAQLSISGGEPSSETDFDTPRVQAALDDCASGSAVELAESGTNNGFLIKPISIPSGVTLLVNAGVTAFASRNPADYQNKDDQACGSVVKKVGNGCAPLIASTKTNGSGIMGYGVIDARGSDKLIVNGETQNYSWYSNTLKAHSLRPFMSQSNPNLLQLNEADNFTLYKITLKNSARRTIYWSGDNGSSTPTNGFIAWDIKLISPFNIADTDGIDLANNSTNITIKNSFISTGDDNVAISSTAEGKPVSNVSITNLHTYSGFGISIGSHTEGGVSNVLVDTLNQAGYSSLSNMAGLTIRSATDRGGPVNNITYQHICQENEGKAIQITPYYIKSSDTSHIPTYSNITLRDITVLANSKGGSGSFTFQGFDANHNTTLTLDNFNVLGKPDLTSDKPQNIDITLGPGTVTTAVLPHYGTGVSYKGNTSDSSEGAYPCASSDFRPLTGELLLSTASATNLQSLPATDLPFTLNAVVEPASAEYPALTKPITFYDGTYSVGTAGIGGNGTLATLVISKVSAGAHTYIAQYPGDNNYSAFSFGSVTITGIKTASTLVSAKLVAIGNARTMVTGGTLQFTAYGTYSDGSVRALPDLQGNAVTLWNTSNHSVAKISSKGHATALSEGTVSIKATIGTLEASPLTITVRPSGLPSVLPSVTISPGADIQAAVTAAPAGTVFVLLAGVYRMQTIVPKDGDTFTGQGSVDLNGSQVLTFLPAAALWAAPAISNSVPTGVCNSTHPLCGYVQDLFIDGTLQTLVSSNVNLQPGNWYFDRVHNKVYIPTAPTGHVIELGNATYAFTGVATGVQIDNVTLEKYATPAHAGTVGGFPRGSNWIINNVESRWNHGTGINLGPGSQILNSFIHNNGQMGIEIVGGTGSTVLNNEISFNNYAGFDQGWEAGGSKLWATTNLVVKLNNVHDNNGIGLWTDGGNVNTLYDSNTVTNNFNEGIKHEISYSAVISNNIVKGNGYSPSVWLGNGQICIQNSSNVEVLGNTVEVPVASGGNGIVIINQNRGTGKLGPLISANDYVHNNTVTYLGPLGFSGAGDDTGGTPPTGDSFDYNQYTVVKAAGWHWRWFQNTNWMNWSQFRVAGQELHGVGQ